MDDFEKCMEILERYELDSVIHEAMASEKVKAVLDGKYAELVGYIAKINLNVPDEQRSVASAVFEKFTDEEARLHFFDCVMDGVKMKNAAMLLSVEESVGEVPTELVEKLKKRFKEPEDVTLKEFIYYSCSVLDFMVHIFFEEAYRGYVPAGMPSKVSEFLSPLGVMIPADAFFSSFDDEE